MKTHQYLLIALTFFGYGILALAQENKLSSQIVPQGPALSKDYLSPDGRFRIRFPDVPKEFDSSYDSKIGQVVSRSLVYASDVTLLVNYTDYPMISAKPDAVKALLDSARDGGLARVAKEVPRILAESDISVDGYPGRFLRVELKGDAIIRFKIVLAGNRLYSLAVGTPKGDARVVDSQNSYEKVASGFFDSFKIMPVLEADLAASWKEFSSAEGKFTIQFPGTPYQSSLPVKLSLKESTFHITGYQSSGIYSVMYLDYPESLEPGDVKTFLDDIRIGELEKSGELGMKASVLSETDSTLGGYPGRFLVAELSDNRIYRRKMFLVKSRIYIITATAPKDDPKTPARNAYETLSMRFINSFSLAETAKH